MFTRLKARNISGFAALEAYPYAEVRQWIQRQIQ
jgi:ATP-dependent DNA helicase RecQ